MTMTNDYILCLAKAIYLTNPITFTRRVPTTRTDGDGYEWLTTIDPWEDVPDAIQHTYLSHALDVAKAIEEFHNTKGTT